MVETKSGRQATKTKTIVTSNVVKQQAAEVDNNATRRSSRAKQPTNKKIELIPSSARTLTNGTPRSVRSHVVTSANSKFQSNLLPELSKKNSNFSPDVVSDLEEILGSPIKTREIRTEQVSRTPSKSEQSSAKSMLRVNYKSHVDDGTKPATRSSKRLSNRIQTTTGSAIKQPRSSSRKSASFNANLSSEESQESQDEAYDNVENHADDNIVMNIKQEKEVSYTMTDDNSLFTCEMCSAVFTDRAHLLLHVPVHI